MYDWIIFPGSTYVLPIVYGVIIGAVLAFIHRRLTRPGTGLVWKARQHDEFVRWYDEQKPKWDADDAAWQEKKRAWAVEDAQRDLARADRAVASSEQSLYEAANKSRVAEVGPPVGSGSVAWATPVEQQDRSQHQDSGVPDGRNEAPGH